MSDPTDTDLGPTGQPAAQPDSASPPVPPQPKNRTALWVILSVLGLLNCCRCCRWTPRWQS